MLDNVPKDIIEAVNNLHWTSGYQISLGFNRPDVAKHLWFYIYDEDIPPARVYSPKLKSSDNFPNGCSSLQAEVFWDCKTEKPIKEVIFNKTIESLKKLCGFKDSDVVLKDIRYEKYSNVSFTHSIYESRAKIRDYLDSLGIQTIGRFGEWDYLWSHQAYHNFSKPNISLLIHKTYHLEKKYYHLYYLLTSLQSFPLLYLYRFE